MLYRIIALNALSDNYIWIIHNQIEAIVVDPTVDLVVINFLHENNLQLAAILVTHGHADHIGGIPGLIKKYADIPIISNLGAQLEENQLLSINGFPLFKILLTPGHTYEHVCYVMDDKHLFCGDTLFSLGCGRVFTGDYPAMYNSLCKLKSLPENILCYPAHEYTGKNSEFTLSIDQNNLTYYKSFQQKLESNLFSIGRSLPTSLSDELKYNLFLRCNDKHVWQLVEQKTGNLINNELDCFKEIRLLRNNF